MVEVRKGMPGVALARDEFRRRFRAQFFDPAYERVAAEVAAIEEVAWDAYSDHRKAPRTAKAGPGFADPDYDLSVEWRATRDAIAAATAAARDGATHVVELAGWDYPQHLAGRAFSVIAHGDTAGADGLRHDLSDTLDAMVTLVERITQLRAGTPIPGASVEEPRPK